MKPTDFAYHLTGYLSKYLPSRGGISRNTIISYRDTFSLLLRFCLEEKALPIEKININTLQKNLIVEFLMWLETGRGCMVSTRNQRLAAIHAFYRYLLMEEPEHIYLCQQILDISMKRTASKSIEYLTLDAMKAVLESPDTSSVMGRRDLVLLSLMYDTGARVQEIADLVVADIRLENPAIVKVTGKGNKSRLIPLMTPTTKLIDQYMTENNLKHIFRGTYPLFQNRSHTKLTRAGIAYILKKYVEEANLRHPGLIPKTVSPHCLRHYGERNEMGSESIFPCV